MSYIISTQVPGYPSDGEVYISNSVEDAVLRFVEEVELFSGHRPDVEDITGFIESGVPCVYQYGDSMVETSLEPC
jgi:hypothetical protein